MVASFVFQTLWGSNVCTQKPNPPPAKCPPPLTHKAWWQIILTSEQLCWTEARYVYSLPDWTWAVFSHSGFHLPAARQRMSLIYEQLKLLLERFEQTCQYIWQNSVFSDHFEAVLSFFSLTAFLRNRQNSTVCSGPMATICTWSKSIPHLDLLLSSASVAHCYYFKLPAILGNKYP